MNHSQPSSNSLPAFLSPRDLVNVLGCARGTVYELLATGAIPSIRIGRVIRVDKADFMRWVEANKVGGDGAPAA